MWPLFATKAVVTGWMQAMNYWGSLFDPGSRTETNAGDGPGPHPAPDITCLESPQRQILVPAEKVPDDPDAQHIDAGEAWIRCDSPDAAWTAEEWL